MNDIKDYGNLCKSHSARSEKEFCRVCPSKLNKKELEDVYFSLLESNLDLKKTINNQGEKIKVLSTKIQRLTAVQKTYLGKEKKDCCGSKAVIIDQKECILELKRSNQSLSERVRQLNMRLCSAKQFLKRSPFQSSSRCNRCSNRTASMSALVSKKSESNLRTAVNSSQYLDKDILSSRSADQEIILHEKGVQYDFCEENKCRTHIEELKQKNEHLEELLSKTNAEHATRTSQYEHELSELRTENVRVRSESTHAEENLKQLREEFSELAGRLGTAETRCDELLVELLIEKRKVFELEMRVRMADMSSRIANAIEAHLSSIKIVKESTSEVRDPIESDKNKKEITPDESPRLTVPSPVYRPKAAVRTKLPQVQADETFKNSDDSGYTEVNKSNNIDDKITSASTYINQVLLEKVADLQNQINNLKSLNGYNSAKTVNASEATQNSKVINNNKSLTDDKQTFYYTFDGKIVPESSEEKKYDDSNEETKDSLQVSKGQSTRVQSTRDIVSENRLTSTEIQSNVQKQEVDKNDGNKRRESFKQFKKRSKEKISEQKKVMNNRKLSLESSKESLVEKNLIKTSSLDEKENLKRLSKDTNTMDIKISQHIDVNNGSTATTSKIKDSRNSTDDNINQRDTYKGQGKDTNVDVKDNMASQNVYIKQTADDTKFKNKEINNKDSDSSKGTYSIHRDDNIVKDSKATQNKDRMKSQRNPENSSKESIPVQQKPSSKIQSNLNILTADLKKSIVNSAVSMENFMSEKRRSSTPSQPRTYVLSGKGKAKPSHALSPDSTEREISSLSDLSSERDERAYLTYRSPGEDKPLTVSESRTDTTTTDYGSLSEGELPCVAETTVLSIGETRLPNRTVKSHSLPISTSQQMEETLAMVKEELSRCTNLLKVHARRSLDGMHRMSDQA